MPDQTVPASVLFFCEDPYLTSYWKSYSYCINPHFKGSVQYSTVHMCNGKLAPVFTPNCEDQ